MYVLMLEKDLAHASVNQQKEIRWVCWAKHAAAPWVWLGCRSAAPGGASPWPSCLGSCEQLWTLPAAGLSRAPMSGRCFMYNQPRGTLLQCKQVTSGDCNTEVPRGGVFFQKKSLWVCQVHVFVLFQSFKLIYSHSLNGLRCFCIITVIKTSDQQ